jgi:long-chain acyl-CoA synthetase
MLSHGNILHNVRVIPDVLPFREEGRFLSFLPSWHSFERTIEYIILDHGMEMHYGSKATLREDFPRVRPTFIAGVPRVYEIFQRSVSDAVRKQRGLSGTLARRCLAASRVLTDAGRRARGWAIRRDGRVIPGGLVHWFGYAFVALFTGVPHVLARKAVYSRLHAALGGRVEAMVSGGGPLPDHVDEFMTRAGLPLLNGYGLTETSPVLTVRRLRRNPLGSIGSPIPETEIRIVDDAGRDRGKMSKGVIQARGPQVMRGYYRNEDATRSALVGDGWFDTGDLGMLSSDGDLMISGRAKETIVLTGGENVEPEPIENRLITSPYIADAFLVGHGQKALGVLLVPNGDALRERGIGDGSADALAADPEVLRILKREVERTISPEAGFRTFERIGRVAVLPRPFSPEDGTLTQSLKKRRAVIEEAYADLIAGLF